MISNQSLTVANKFWSSHLGVDSDSLFSTPLQLVEHGTDLANYNGIFALFTNSAAIISFPADRFAELSARIPPSPFTPADFAHTFESHGLRVIGPAYIGYANAVPSPIHNVRSLTKVNVPAVSSLRAACNDTEWEHGGSTIVDQATSGLIIDSELVALASYEVWKLSIAHISVITHPAHRGHGYGRSVVSHNANLALAAGLIPQYRTLESNAPSVEIANRLGFAQFATSVAVRLPPRTNVDHSL
jgi:GNAT superfamily N-acetyltransferase